MRKISAFLTILAFAAAVMPARLGAAGTPTVGGVQGSVNLTTGQPLNLATVRLFDPLSGAIVASATTNASGWFTLSNVTPSVYTLQVLTGNPQQVVGTRPVVITAGKMEYAAVSASAAAAGGGAAGGHAIVVGPALGIVLGGIATAISVTISTVQAQQSSNPTASASR
jgi:hypothetical protein